MKFPMLKWAKDLFPLNRSLTGEGTRKTLQYFRKLNPELKIINFKNEKKVFDWVIPKEWHIKNAYIEHESGKRFAEFKKCNLHVLGYSTPVNKVISKKKLLNYIYSLSSKPDSVPYVTSYYEQRWGFCLSENQKKKLPEGKYKVFIDSKLINGNLEINHAVLKGKVKKEIFFSSYICHPSMANNELSGPVLLNAIMLYIKSKYPKTKYSYRFVLLPETIGPIAYLSKFKNIMKKNILFGFNLTCVGDERAYTIINTPSENTIADQALQAALFGLPKVKNYSFLHRGSDERQYCSPNVDLPVCRFSRSKDFPEYHTNKDNFNVVTQKGLMQSLNVMKQIVDACELGLYPKTTTTGEPNLGKRNLQRTISHQKNYKEKDLLLRRNLIAYANGKRNIFEIANLFKVPLNLLHEEHKLLRLNKILK